MRPAIFILVCTEIFTALTISSIKSVCHTSVLIIVTHLCYRPRIFILSLIITYTWSVMNGIWRRMEGGKPITFWELRENLLEEIISYNISNHLYPSDERTRMVAVSNQEKRRKRVIPSEDISEKEKITKSNLSRANHTRHKVVRLCGDLENLQKHIDPVA